MTEKEPASESPGLTIFAEGPNGGEESGTEPAVKAGTLSVVYPDGPDSPPRLVLSGEPGVPETLLVVDAAGTPVAQYTAGPLSTTRGENHARGHFLPAGHSAIVPAVPVVPLLSD